MGWGRTAQPEARSLPLPALPPRPSPSLLGLTSDVACHVTCAHLQAGHPSSGTGHRLWPPGVFEHLGAIVAHPPRKLLGLLFILKTPGHFGNADPGADPHARAAGRVAGPPPCRPRDARPTLTLQFPLVTGRVPGEPAAAAAGPRSALHTVVRLSAPAEGLSAPPLAPTALSSGSSRLLAGASPQCPRTLGAARRGLALGILDCGVQAALHLGRVHPALAGVGMGPSEADRDSLMEAGGRLKSRALGVGAGSVWLCGHGGHRTVSRSVTGKSLSPHRTTGLTWWP